MLKMRYPVITLLRLVMSQSRLKVLQRHLCCSVSAVRSVQTSPIYSPVVRGLATTATSTVDETLFVVQTITQTNNVRPTENAALVIMNNYHSFTNDERSNFLTRLATNHQCDPQEISSSMASLNMAVSTTSPPHRQQQKLRDSLTSPYELLFRVIGSAVGGVKFLVDLRSDLIKVARQCAVPDELASLQAMNHNLKEMLALWFGVGFLALERITWSSPCDLLERVANHEGVHPVRNVSDLRLRVGAYRRCYTFLHPSMPREPVVILHVALVKEISGNIQSIVHHPTLSNQSDFKLNYQTEEDPSRFNSAVFYSITSTQAGLKGIDLGNYLIKSVVKQLHSEFPHLSQFSSLSPIPGFRDWLFTEINQQVGGVKEEPLLNSIHVKKLSAALRCQSDTLAVLSELKRTLQDGVWCKDAHLAEGLKDTLMYLCARYLYLGKHRNFALNSVANFHLRNGATLWRINWLANTTAKGLTESCGLMVNYRYYLDRTSVNSEQYNTRHVVDSDKQVLDLLT